MFAAETWRRKHERGTWKWETVFTDISSPTPNQQQITKWISTGLAYWKRPILKSRLGHSEYLITIACEGGLPLLLLKNENAHLYRYFKSLLEVFHRERRTLNCEIISISRRFAPLLPRSLRHDIVYQLGADLIQKVVDLQEKVTDAVNPISALDQRLPGWREDLPLPLEDHTVELLLKNLVNEAKSLSLAERQRIGWRRLLVQKNGNWTIEQFLEMPQSVTGAFLQGWTKKSPLPPRFRLYLKTAKGFETVAVITRLRGEDLAATYRCEILKRGGIKLSGTELLTEFQLVLSDGTAENEVPAKGGEELGPLPWVFVERDGQLEFLGEGSVRCRDNTAQVLLPLSGRYEMSSGQGQKLDVAPLFEREIYRISGTMIWMHSELGLCRIQCANPDETAGALQLNGRRLMGTAEQMPPFLGMPDIYNIDQNGVARLLANSGIEWRPGDGRRDSLWRKDRESCAGEVWIRCKDITGDQIFRRKVRVAPRDCKIKILQTGAGDKPGKVLISGILDAIIDCVDIDGCKFIKNTVSDGIEIQCFSRADLTLTEFLVRVLWPDGRFIDLRLPFPKYGAMFVRGDEVLPNDARVPIARLASVQAVVQVPTIGQKIDMVGIVVKDQRTWKNMSIKERFDFDSDGRSIFFLHRIQDKISSFLSLTAELDSSVILEIIEKGGRSLARLEIGQFDMELVPDYENHVVTLPMTQPITTDPNGKGTISVRLVPLRHPGSEALVLRPNEFNSGWRIPNDLEPGPWWVLGEDGDWARFRPLLWNVPGEFVCGDSPLERAIIQPEKHVREEILNQWTSEIAANPDHSDWMLFFDFLHLIRPYPASSLDLFRSFIRSPEAMVLALLQSTDENFDAVWSLAQQLPYSWYLVPVRAWFNAGNRFFSSIKLEFSQFDPEGELAWEQFQRFRERVTNRRPFFRQICDWLCLYLFPDRPLQGSELALAVRIPEFIMEQIIIEEQNFQGRHEADEIAPEALNVMIWTEHCDYPEIFKYNHLSLFRHVRCAPFVAAHISLCGENYDRDLLFEINAIYDFDRQWFNSAYAFALCLGLGERVRKSAGDMI